MSVMHIGNGCAAPRTDEGGLPIRRWNSALKLPTLENPTARHTSVTDWPASSSVTAMVKRDRIRV